MKIFLSDLDGTLLRDKQEIHISDVEAIKQLQAQGVSFGIATGRDLGFCRQLLKQYSLNADIMILNNGGSLFINEEKIMEMELSASEIKRIMHCLQPYIGDLHPFVCDENRTFYMMRNCYDDAQWMILRQELSYLGNIAEEDVLQHLQHIDSPIIKLTIYLQDASKTGSYLNLLKEQFGSAYEVLMTASDYIEFTKKGVHKGSALLQLEKQLGITREDVAFIGDGENDIALMDLAGCSFCMDTAASHVAVHAQRCVASVREAIAILNSCCDSDSDHNDNKKCHIQ